MFESSIFDHYSLGVNMKGISARERVEAELGDVSKKLGTLQRFIGTDAFFKLPEEQQILLYLQANTMDTYVKILLRRLKIWQEYEQLDQ